MAIFRPAPLIGAISGNIGGVNFVQSKAGPVVRQRIRKTRQRDDQGFNVRARMSQLRKAWQTLQENQRTAWRQAASTFPFTNRLGVRSNLSGFQLFIKINMFISQVPGTDRSLITLDPPPLGSAIPWEVTAFSVTAGGSKALFITETIPSNATAIVIFGARTFSTSQRKTWYTFRTVFSRAVSPTPFAIGNWDDVVGDPQLGEQCWIKVFFAAPPYSVVGPFLSSTFAI